MKNFLVIGGSSGIGKQISTMLVSEGHAVFSSYNTNYIPDNKNVKYFPLNVLEKIELPNWLPEQIDGFVYCPGSISLKPFHRLTKESFLMDYELNVLGALEILKQILPRLKSASVVFFSTIAAQKGMKYHAQVAASKGAIEGITHALAAELAPNIRVNAVAPSLTETPLSASLLKTDQQREGNAKRHPLQRFGNVEDIAAAVCFLLSEKSSWITGQVLHVDGGFSTINL
ncbi:MAG: SDR family oxidoreductase [Bacteroidales bacterium]|nr:SDR family oxidoreductase [Bacteroidales bacterium]